MVRSKRELPFSVLRSNKKGHTIYSVEDIREQYCITRTELEVLENSLRQHSSHHLFGCLSTSHLPESHCNKNSFLLLNCVHKKHSSLDLNEQQLQNSMLEEDSRRCDEEDSSDGGFKQIPRRRHTTHTTHTTQVPHQTNADTTMPTMPTMQQLYLMEIGEINRRSLSQSVDELSNSYCTSGLVKTTDTIIDDIKKHVTFASNHLVRSATVGGINNIENCDQSMCTINERLLNGQLFRKCESSNLFVPLSHKPYTNIANIAVRRVIMKTQATQTDAIKLTKQSFASNSISDYLTDLDLNDSVITSESNISKPDQIDYISSTQPNTKIIDYKSCCSTAINSTKYNQTDNQSNILTNSTDFCEFDLSDYVRKDVNYNFNLINQLQSKSWSNLSELDSNPNYSSTIVSDVSKTPLIIDQTTAKQINTHNTSHSQLIKVPIKLLSKSHVKRPKDMLKHFEDHLSTSTSDTSPLNELHSLPDELHSYYSPAESIASTHFSSNVDEFDSETTVYDICSTSETSTALSLEPTTVLENLVIVKRNQKSEPNQTQSITQSIQHSPMNTTMSMRCIETNLDYFTDITEHIPVEQIIEETVEESSVRTEDDGSVSGGNSSAGNGSAGNGSGSAGVAHRSQSLTELSTVSEVSEEISCAENEMISSGNYVRVSHSNNDNDYDSANVVSTISDNNGQYSTSSLSLSPLSTTSASFMIDGNVTAPTSLADSNQSHHSLHSLHSQPFITKAESLPCISSQTVLLSDVPKQDVKHLPNEMEICEKLTLIANHHNSHYSPIVGQLIDLCCESSQATERDVELTDFSLQHQSSIADIEDIEDNTNNTESLRLTSSAIKRIKLTDAGLTLSSKTDTSDTTDTIDTTDKIEKNDELNVYRIKRNNSSSESQTTRQMLSQEEYYIMQRRARSLSRSPDLAISSTNRSADWTKWTNNLDERCTHHYFTCSQCGEAANNRNVSTIIRRSRLEKTGIPYLYRKSMTIDDIYFDGDNEEEDIGVHAESYRSALWVYISKKEEIMVWNHRNTLASNGEKSLQRSESDESTLSERGFKKQYEAITHRLIHRKASIEMYKRVLNRTFVIEKCLTLHRTNGEFGFRIHGSRPVVVSAIEKGTAAENCGLEVGDIIVSVNGVNVLDLSHSEVVKLAHTGSDTLNLEIVCTSNCIKTSDRQVEHDIIMNGYLSRLTHRTNNKIMKHGLDSEDGMDGVDGVDGVDSEDGVVGVVGVVGVEGVCEQLWRRRWFVLKSDYCLYWYKSSTQNRYPIGVISLQGYCAGVSQQPINGQSFAFRLIRYATQPKYFAATDNETACQWVNAINQSATRINQIDPYIDATLHNIHRNPLSFQHLDCYGYLAKFSKRRKVWRHRYFVLKDACLYFYHDANSNTALGIFYLHGYKVQSCSMIGKKHTIEAIPPEPKYRHLWLLTESDADKKRWLAALEYSIDRWIKLN